MLETRKKKLWFRCAHLIRFWVRYFSNFEIYNLLNLFMHALIHFFLFSFFLCQIEFSDYIFICICIWFLTLQHTLAQPTNLFNMQQRSLQSKLQHPCGVNYYVTSVEDIDRAELKALFNVIYTQTEIARDQADADIKNYVCIQHALFRNRFR